MARLRPGYRTARSEPTSPKMLEAMLEDAFMKDAVTAVELFEEKALWSMVGRRPR
jgi:hypothetical protein